MSAVVIICWVCNRYIDTIWMKFAIKLFHIIHFASVFCIGIALFILLLKMIIDRIAAAFNEKELNTSDDDESYKMYPDLNREKLEDDGFVFVSDKTFKEYVQDCFRCIMSYNRMIWNKEKIIGMGLFLLYLYIASDDVLMPQINLLNIIPSGQILMIMWMIYVFYVLYLMTRCGIKSMRNKWNNIKAILPFISCSFVFIAVTILFVSTSLDIVLCLFYSLLTFAFLLIIVLFV